MLKFFGRFFSDLSPDVQALKFAFVQVTTSSRLSNLILLTLLTFIA